MFLAFGDELRTWSAAFFFFWGGEGGGGCINYTLLAVKGIKLRVLYLLKVLLTCSICNFLCIEFSTPNQFAGNAYMRSSQMKR